MGSNTARDLAESVQLKDMKLRIALATHLRYNHFPAVPLSMIDPCIRAIKKANRGEWNKKVRLPSGATYRGHKLAPVQAIIENHHLGYFLEGEE